MEYEGEIDIECVPLCDVINKLPGIRTIESCCGHDKKDFRIWFEAEDLKYLPPLLYFFDVCHCGFHGWSVLVTTDCGMSPVHFNIKGKVGAYEEANKIALLIEKYIKEK